MSDSISKIYDATMDLLKAEDKSTCVSSYEVIIEAAKGADAEKGAQQKLLASQNIPKYFGFFADPDLVEKAINALLDLCEDDSLQIRCLAVRGLVVLCTATPSLIPRLADVLGQLLVAEDSKELKTVRDSFEKLFEIDSKASFLALMQQIKDGDENIRAKDVEFLKQQFNKRSKAINNKEDNDLGEALATGFKQLLASGASTAQEFRTFFSLLNRIQAFKTSPGAKEEASSFIESQAALDKDFDPANTDYISQFITCLNYTSRGGDNGAFLDYFFNKIVPNTAALSDSDRTKVFRAVTDTTSSASTSAVSAQAYITPLFNLVKEQVPTEGKDDDAKIDYQATECYLYMFHQFAAKARDQAKALCGVFVPTGQPSDFLSDGLKARKDDFVARLTFLQASGKARAAGSKAALTELSKELKNKELANEDKAALRDKKNSIIATERAIRSIGKLASALTTKIPTFLSGKAAPNPSYKKPKKGQNQQQSKKTQEQKKGGKKKQEQKKGGNKKKGGEQKKQQKQQQKGGKGQNKQNKKQNTQKQKQKKTSQKQKGGKQSQKSQKQQQQQRGAKRKAGGNQNKQNNNNNKQNKKQKRGGRR